MSITAKELAKKLNLSAAAVSMALNNKPGVSTDTRRRILDAADRYGYDFTRIAQKQNAAGTIYLVIYKKHGAIVDDTPFFSQLSEGISDACNQAGYKLRITYLFGEDQELLPQIEEIQYSDCIGIILLGTEMQKEDALLFQQLSIPCLLYTSRCV